MSSKIQKEIEKEKLARQKEFMEKALKEHAEHHSGGSVSRRDLLGMGVFSFTASMTLPTLAGMMLPNVAQAADCPVSTAGSTLSPFVTLNLAGGGMLAANYVPMDRNRQPLPSYNKMGLGNGSLNIEREFGNVPFAGDDGTGRIISQLLVELRNNTSQTTRDRTAFVAIPVRSRDDSDMNPFDVTGLVAKAGLIGSDLPNLGRRASDTGVRQMFAKVKPPTPLIIGNYGDLSGALGLGQSGPLAALNDDQKISLVKLISRLSESQTNRVNANAGGRMLANLISCATGKNVELAEKPQPSMDVRDDTTLSGIWNANNQNDNNEGVVFGSMVNAALKGVAGTVNLERGGYDYHNGTRTTGDQRDGQAGAVIGRILESAAALNKKVFIYVTSDGSCVSPTSDDRSAPWRSDRGSAGMAYILAFDPAGRPATSDFQIGHFVEGQAADDSFITGDDPELAASAAFANYLKFNGRMDLVTPTLGNTFSSSDLDQIIKFG